MTAPKAGVFVTNLPQFLGRITLAQNVVINEGLKEGVEQALEVYAEDWAARAPVRDQDYQQSIEAGPTRVRKTTVAGTVWPHYRRNLAADQQPIMYAEILEFGGRVGGGGFVAAQPSMRPAFDSKNPEASKRVEMAMIKAIAKLGIGLKSLSRP